MVRIFQAEDLVVRVGLEMYCSFMNFRKGCTYPPVHSVILNDLYALAI